MGEDVTLVATPTVVPILLYHSVCAADRTPEDRWQVNARDFQADMRAVADSGRTAVTASGYGACLRDGTPAAARPVLITFDDGFADYAQVVRPILDDFGFPSTLFVTTGWLGREGMLSARELREVADAGTEIGSHTVTHPYLDVLPEALARRELATSRQVLEDLTGRVVTTVAYPHGSHHARTKAIAADCGYLTGFAVKNAISHTADDPYAVARYTVDARTSRWLVQEILDGRGAPLSWSRERWRTRGYRAVRRLRAQVGR